VFRQRTFVGLDVHARSVVGHVMDEHTGEVWQQRLPTDRPGIWGWLESLPQPVKVTYEAGPTGYSLARFLRGRGIVCPVAAPSKLTRRAVNRVKTDAKDAEHLCRLLRLDEIVEVIVPDTVKRRHGIWCGAREDVRGDLMGARHRASKLLLRQGIVYPGRKTWTAPHQRWLQQQRFEVPARQLAFEDAVKRCC
jgi:transposase